MALSRKKTNVGQQQHFECGVAWGGEHTATSGHYKFSYCCKVADVANVAGIGRRIPVFSFADQKVINTSNALNSRLTLTRASVCSLCNLALREKAQFDFQLI